MIWLLWAEISWIYWISWTSCPEYPGCATLASNLQGVWPAVWVGGDHLQLAGGWSGKALGCWLVLLLTTTASATNTSSSSTTTTTTTSSTTILLSTLHKLLLLLTQAAAILLTLKKLLRLNGGSGLREHFNWLRRGNDERQQWFQSKFDTSALKKYPLVTSGDGENWDELDLITNAQIMQGKMLNIWFSQIMSILHSGRQSSRPFQFTHFCSSPVLAWYKTVGTCWNCWNTVELLEEMATAGRLTTQIIRHTNFSEYFALCVCLVNHSY